MRCKQEAGKEGSEDGGSILIPLPLHLSLSLSPVRCQSPAQFLLAHFHILGIEAKSSRGRGRPATRTIEGFVSQVAMSSPSLPMNVESISAAVAEARRASERAWRRSGS